MDFIITSPQSWDIEIGSTIKNTALEISKSHRVLYVNPPLDIATRLRVSIGSRHYSPVIQRQMDVQCKAVSPIRRINKNLWVLDCPFSIHSVGQLPLMLFKALNRQNNKKIGEWIVKQAFALHFDNYIHLIDTDLYRSLHLKEYIHPALSIYYRRDYVIGVPYWRKHGPRSEEELTRRADIVLANSSYFAEQLRPWNPNVHVLNTGVNLELYDARKTWEKPEDIAEIPSPIIGYTGTILESRLDSNLLYAVAKRLPEYQFIFVGPEDEHFSQHPLHSLKNVHFTGRKKVEQLPQYIRYFDVCINPQRLNPITEGNYPLKIDEYLAMGKPVVATSTHTMRDVFSAHTHLADDGESWVKELQRAVGEANNKVLESERIAFAHTHSWGHSIETIYNAIKEFNKKKF